MITEVSPVNGGRKSLHTADTRHLVVKTVNYNTKGSFILLSQSGLCAFVPYGFWMISFKLDLRIRFFKSKKSV